jgi:mono/diheme cytochrome c family protein
MMMNKTSFAVAMCFALMFVMRPGPALSQSATAADPTDAGKAVFKKANCMGCHKWHGNGGGGYGGDALSLRKTQLTKEQIVETATCGRPGTGMPFFARGAYDTVKCYGMDRKEVGDQMPPEGGTFLRPADIDAVADYVIAHVKGKGEPTYAECTSFFSDTSRVCDIYKTGTPAPTSGESAGKNINDKN